MTAGNSRQSGFACRCATSPFRLPKSTFFDIVFLFNARVAQLVEHSTDTRGVHGSNPCTRTK